MDYTIENFKKGLIAIDNRNQNSYTKSLLNELMPRLGIRYKGSETNFVKYSRDTSTKIYCWYRNNFAQITTITVEDFYKILFPKPKVGDLVTIVEVSEPNGSIDSLISIGEIHKLISIGSDNLDRPYYVSDIQNSYRVFCKDVRKATQEEIDSLTKEKLYSIDDLANGKVALINEDHPDVEKVLRLAFPQDKNCNSNLFNKFLNWKYCTKEDDSSLDYTVINNTTLPKQSAKDFINQINTNGKREKNEVSRITSENRKSNIAGTIILRCGRQQITTGIRPEGNLSISSTGKTRFNSLEIRKNIIKSENY